jgi:hypothetical protein
VYAVLTDLLCKVHTLLPYFYLILKRCTKNEAKGFCCVVFQFMSIQWPQLSHGTRLKKSFFANDIQAFKSETPDDIRRVNFLYRITTIMGKNYGGIVVCWIVVFRYWIDCHVAWPKKPKGADKRRVSFCLILLRGNLYCSI